MQRLFSFAVRAYVVVVLLSAPVCLLGIVWGYRLIAEQSLVAFIVICIATMNMTVRFALLLDDAKAKNQRDD